MIWAASVLPGWAQPGTLDLSFDPGAGPDNWVSSLLVQTDGKIVIAGGFSTVAGVPRKSIARLAIDGSVDPSFNPGIGPDYGIYSLAQQGDGRILIGGYFYNVSGEPRRCLARLNSDGSLDSAFVPPAAGSASTIDGISAIAIQPDGKIVIGGSFYLNQPSGPNCVARLNPDGSLDTEFKVGTGAQDSVNAITLQPDGRILIGGAFTSVNGTHRNRIARFNPDGTLDLTFDPGIGPNWIVNSVVLLPEGRVLLGGLFLTISGVERTYLARLNADGSLDTSFDPGKIEYGVSAIALQADGKILIGGPISQIAGIAHSSIARLHPNGALDPTFDSGRFEFGSVSDLALQSDGQILVLGDFAKIGGVPRSRIARLNQGGDISAGRFQFGAPTYSVDEAGTNLTIPVLRIGGSATQATVQFATSDGTALANQDYVAQSGTLTFAAGITSQTISIPIQDDSAVEPEETFNVTLSHPTDGALLGTQSQTQVTIRDDDTEVIFNQGEYRVSEPAGNAMFYLNRNGNLQNSLTVRWVARGGTATAGVDFVGVTNVIAFAPGENLKLLSVTILDDALTEPNETVDLSVSRYSTDGALLQQNRATLVLLDNEHAGGLDPGFDSGSSPFNIVTSLALTPGNQVIAGGSFGVRRYNADGSRDPGFIPPTEIETWVRMLAVQPDEKVLVGGQFTRGLMRLNPDGSTDTGFNAGPMAITSFILGGLAIQPDGKTLVGGNFTYIGGTPRNRIARLMTDGTCDPTFNPGTGADQNVNAIALQLDGKVVMGGAFERVNGGLHYGLARLNPDGSLDTTYTPQIDTGAVTALLIQPDGRAVIAGGFEKINGIPRNHLARLNPDGSLDANFEFISNVLSGGVFALAVDASGRILVAGGNLLMRLLPNGSLDPSFDSGHRLNGSMNALLQQGNGKILIGGDFTTVDGLPRPSLARLNNDADSGAGQVGFVNSRWVINENSQTNLTLTVARTGAARGEIKVPYGVAGGTATLDRDFQFQKGFLTFADGDTSNKTFTLAPLDDALPEPDETIVIWLGPPLGGATWAGPVTAEIVLPDDDVSFEFSQAAYTAQEGDGPAPITIERSGGLSHSATVDFVTSDGSAIAGSDYTARLQTLNFRPGETAQTVTVAVIDDTLREEDETLHLSLRNPSAGAQLGAQAEALLIIPANDYPPQRFQSASLRLQCRSLALLPATESTTDGEIRTTLFTTPDGDRNNLPQRQENGAGIPLFSGELRPQPAQPETYETDFVTFQGSTTNVLEFGSLRLQIPIIDTDRNGLADLVQWDQDGTTSVTGVWVTDWPTRKTNAVAGQLNRAHNSAEGNFKLTLADGQSSRLLVGRLQLQVFLLSTLFTREQQDTIKVSCVRTNLLGRPESLTATTRFQVNSTESVSLFNLYLADTHQFYSVPSVELLRNGTSYRARVAMDGLPQTGWSDYSDWDLELIDSNDADGNGVPDFSDFVEGFPVIWRHPQDLTVTPGTDVTFSVKATGVEPLKYQWYFEGVAIPLANGPTFIVTNVPASRAGSYSVSVTNELGSAYSAAATLRLVDSIRPPVERAWVSISHCMADDYIGSKLVLDPVGHAYVSSRGLHQGWESVAKFDTNGTVLWIRNTPTWDIALDATGNVYVTGSGLAAGGQHYDCVTTKFDPDGNQLWSARYDGAGRTDSGTSLALDAQGGVSVAGYSTEAGGTTDYLVVKYDARGNQLWSDRFPAGGTINPLVTVAPTGETWVAGTSLMLKYSAAGGRLWAQTNASGWPTALVLDSLGTPYVASYKPGSTSALEYGVTKYRSNGQSIWETYYTNGVARALVVDTHQHVYLASSTAGVIKLDAHGKELWVSRFSNSDTLTDTLHGLAIDAAGNVYAAGTWSGTGQCCRVAATKFDATGALMWTATYSSGDFFGDVGSSVAVDPAGNVFVAGALARNCLGTMKFVQIPPGASVLPETQAISAGSTVALVGLLQGAKPQKYQWKLGGTALSGETHATLILTNVSPADIGSYTVEIQDSTAGSSSATGQLQILAPTPFHLEASLWAPDKLPQFTLTGEARRTVIIETSSDLMHWRPFSRMTLQNGPEQFYDRSLETQGQRLFRATLPP